MAEWQEQDDAPEDTCVVCYRCHRCYTCNRCTCAQPVFWQDAIAFYREHGLADVHEGLLVLVARSDAVEKGALVRAG